MNVGSSRLGGRLVRKFTLSTASLICGLALALTFVAGRMHTSSNERELRERWTKMTNVAAGALGNSIALLDYDEMARFVRRVAEDDDVLHFRLYRVLPADTQTDGRGDVLMLAVDSERGDVLEIVPYEGSVLRVISRQETQIERVDVGVSEPFMRIAFPVNGGQKSPWVGQIELSLADLEASNSALYQSLFILSIAFVGAGIVGGFLLARHVTAPVETMYEVATRVADGDFDAVCGLTRRDELGDLGRAFDGMTTKLRNAHNELAGVAVRVESVLASMPDALLVVEPASEAEGWAGEILITEANAAATRMLRFDAQNLIGRPLATILPQPRVQRSIVDSLLAGEPVRGLDTAYRRSHSQLVPVRLSASAMRGAPNPMKPCPLHLHGDCVPACPSNIQGFVLVATDLSESRRSERIRGATLDIVQASHVAVDMQELYITVDVAMERLVGIDGLHIVQFDVQSRRPVVEYVSAGYELPHWELDAGLTALALSAPDRTRFTRAEIVELRENGLVHLDGEPPSDWIGVPLSAEGRPVGLLVVHLKGNDRRFSDEDANLIAFVSTQIGMAIARKRIEQERARLTSAVEHAADAILITDVDGAIEYVNPAFSSITGRDRDASIGRSVALIGGDAHDESFFREIWSSVSKGQPWTGRINGTTIQGGAYTVDTAVSSVRDATGQVTHCVAVLHDLSNEISLEAQLRHAQKMEAIGKLAGGVAHDFNNLLSVINGYAKLMSDSVEDEETREYIEEIAKAGNRAAGLTRQLLAFSRRQVLKPRILEVPEVIRDIEKMLRRLIDVNIELVVDLPEGLGVVEADPGQLEQVLMNLVVNARDAMEDGGVITITAQNAELDAEDCAVLTEVEPGEYVEVAIEDTGSGIDDETISRIFEPFFTTKEVGKGTGLGLSTVYGIVKQSGGHIAVESEVGTGTTFRVFLPRVAQSDLDITQAIADAPVARGEETVLLAEDEDGVRKLASLILRRRGYAVIEARDGHEALDKMESFEGKIDLLLTDVVMPHMGGRQLYDECHVKRPETRVLFMSGYADSAIVQNGVIDNGTSFIEKPFVPEALLARVREILDDDPAVVSA